MNLAKEFRRNIAEIDLIVFDIDGVLIDTSESFPEAIVKAVNRYGELEGFSDWTMPSKKEVAAFKQVPGFNNDWDLAEGLLAFNLYNLVDKRGVTLPEFLAKVTASGGGLAGIREWIGSLSSSETKKLHEKYTPKQIRQLAMEYYAGEKYCEQLYGFRPEYNIRIGAMENETLLVNPEILNQLQLHYTLGIYTGRDPDETSVALRQIGFNGFQEKCIATDDGESPTKPDPRPLKQMLDRVDGTGLVFIGDSRDDYVTIENFRDAYANSPGEFIQVSPELKPFEPDTNVVQKVNELLDILVQLAEN